MLTENKQRHLIEPSIRFMDLSGGFRNAEIKKPSACVRQTALKLL